MDEINKLLETTGFLSLKDTGLTIISFYGVNENSENVTVTYANRMVGNKVFSFRNEPLLNNTIEIAHGLQLYIDNKSKTVYMFMDSNIETTQFAKEKSFTASMMDHQSTSMKGLLFMLTVSHLVIPILPPTLLPTEFLSTLVALGQVKANMYTHLAQYQSACWKHWDIQFPSTLFEKKEFERVNPAFLGWWGPAKGVPILVFVATNIPFQQIVPAAIKKVQDSLQIKLKNIFRALHLVPLKPEGNTPNPPVEVRSLFLLPSSSQPIIHIIPARTKNMEKKMDYSFNQPVSLSSLLDTLYVNSPTDETLYQDYGDKLLRNFVSIWAKVAISRHPLHNSRKGDKSTQLPTGIQFLSAIVPLLAFIFNKTITEDGIEFKKIITAEFPSTKGMTQQIEVILRKKIKDNIEIERVFSKSHSMDVMQKCLEAYLQDSPPYYTEQYHKWKQLNVMRMYRSLARGPCMEECATRLERECETTWRNGRQSCEHVSLTGKSCRLKLGHETEIQKQARDERNVFIDPAKHSSGVNFFHACNCGKTQRVRDDPFDMEDANIRFYNKFTCCLGQDRAALDIAQSTFGEEQKLVLNHEEIPNHDAALIYLGPSTVYKNNVGLDKVDGFTNNTNFLIPWSIATINEVKLRNQQQQKQIEQHKDRDTIEWPALGTAAPPPSTIKPAPTVIASLEAFPALGTNPTPASTPAPKQLFDTGSRRKRHNRGRERLQGLIRGYVGAEYECPKGHRFFSCGEGRVCKLGHADHPKEHGNYFVHQDLSIYIMCPCSNDTTAQLQRLYIVTPENSITISIEPKIQLTVGQETMQIDLGISTLNLGPSSMYVLRLPFIYRMNGIPIPVEADVQKRIKSVILLKDCIKFHFKESENWA